MDMPTDDSKRAEADGKSLAQLLAETARGAQFVAMVRDSPVFGRGTCSVVDECWSDDELVEMRKEHSTPAQALRVLSEMHEIWQYRVENSENLW